MKTIRARYRINALWAAGLAAMFVSLAGTDAFASPLPETPYSVNVHYDARDLASDRGTAKVYRQIKNAARRVCFATSEPWDGARTRHYWECYEAALAKAVSDVHSTNLTAFHQAQESPTQRKRPS
jgi:UrcA family protein